MSRIKTGGLLLLGVFAATLALARPAVAAHEGGVAGQAKADAAIQKAREAMDALVKVGPEAAPAPEGRRAERAAARQQRILERASQELARATELYNAGDHVRAQRFAEKASRFIHQSQAPQREGGR